MRPPTMRYFEWLCLTASFAIEMIFFAGCFFTEPVPDQFHSKIIFYAASLLIGGPILFVPFSLPYWLGLLAGRVKSGVASFLLHLYFIAVVFLFCAHVARHGMAHFSSMGVFLHAIILALALLCYWTPDSREWMRRDLHEGMKRAY